jgi:hypothetical protein
MTTKIRNYLNLVGATITQTDLINELVARMITIQEIIFPERLQMTKGILKRKPTDFVVPNKWRKDDPCTVTIFRNGEVDALSDTIFNMGTPADVKTFRCPCFSEDTPCIVNCQYRKLNNEYMEFARNLKVAQEKRDSIVAQRRAAWKQIFARNSK